MNSDAITSPSSSNYVMGRTSEEYERLRRQSEAMEPITRSVLARVGLSAGMSCLDLGCGPGEVMRLMAEQVGQTGLVVGIDVDAKLGGEMLSVLKSKGYEQCSFIEGSVEALGTDRGRSVRSGFCPVLTHALGRSGYGSSEDVFSSQARRPHRCAGLLFSNHGCLSQGGGARRIQPGLLWRV